MLIRTSAVYMLANGISAVIGFLLVMTITRLINPAAYGIYVIANSLGFIIVSLMFTWLRQSLLRFESEGGSTDLRLTALVGYGATLLVLPLAFGLIWWGLKTPPVQAAATVFLAAAVGLFELSQEIARARQKPWHFLSAVAIRSSSALALAIAAAMLGYGGLGLIFAAATGHLLAAFVMAPWIWEAPRRACNRERLKAFVTFGAPITFAGIFYAVHAGLDRLIIAGSLGTEAAGQYGAAADFVRQAINLPAAAASAAITPMAVYTLTHDGPDATRKHLSDGIVLLTAVVGPAAMGLALVAPHVAAIVFGEAYRATAIQLIPFLALAWFGHAIAQHYVHLSFNLANRSSLYIWQGAATLIAGIALIPLGIKTWGLIGAAMGLMASEWLGVLVGLALTRRAHPLPFPLARLLAVGIALIAMATTVLLLKRLWPEPTTAATLALVVLSGCVYGAALLAFDVLGLRSTLARLLSRRTKTHAV